ncbi:hypothetical protein CRI94_11985 [Longibacter salinarum]|uniref:Outer membrane protein beta-barrel domain-containing protein n=1 Tax=Longibacter salinarum TaxID=1850348 RepID=A0A2A8CVW2_9BACT|nr:hypothetical protein [Longibacter salinarum]PEN12741.1 hypothetical protein CRI94_11985 [Longibacter salinarum]
MQKQRLQAVSTIAILLLMLLTAPSAQGQAIVKVGPRMTVEFGDISDAPGDSWALGGDARIRHEEYSIQANGAIDYYSINDDLSVLTLDVNAVFVFITEDQALMPYVGLGLGVARVSSSGEVGESYFGGDRTEAGLNIVGGAELDLGLLRPFAQAQFTNGNEIDRFGMSVGLLVAF